MIIELALQMFSKKSLNSPPNENLPISILKGIDDLMRSVIGQNNGIEGVNDSLTWTNEYEKIRILQYS